MVIKLITVCPWGINSVWTILWQSKKQMRMDFIFDLLILAFFGCGDAEVCHSLLCLFVSGLYSKIHVSSPVITFFKKFLSLWIHCRRWRHTSFQLSGFWNNLCTQFSQANSCVKIWWTMEWFKFNSLAIIHTVSRWSNRTRACTFSTLLSVFEVEGLPEWGSSLMDSRPSENALYHLNTCDLEKAFSPWPVSVYW